LQGIARVIQPNEGLLRSYDTHAVAASQTGGFGQALEEVIAQRFTHYLPTVSRIADPTIHFRLLNRRHPWLPLKKSISL
jgi:hypothetical protein